MLRLGIVLLVVAVLGLTAAVPLITDIGFDGWGVAFLGVFSLLAIVGLGLFFRARFARWCGAVFFLLVGGASIWQCGKLLVRISPNAPWTIDFSLWIANALATTLLLAWLSVRAIQILVASERPARRLVSNGFDTHPPNACGGKRRCFAPSALWSGVLHQTPSLLTARITGVVLVIVGLAHLKAALTMGFVASGYSVSISAEGTQLFGFPGWILWHSAAIPVGLCLIGGWQRLLPVAALCLTVLVGILCPLLLLVTWDSGRAFGSAPLLLMVLGGMVPLLLTYLCWWLAVELQVSWKTVDKRDLLFGLAALGLLVSAAAIYVSQQSSMTQQDRIEAIMADVEDVEDVEDFEEFERAEMQKRMKVNRSAPPLDDTIIPTTDVWFCGSSSGVTGNCDFYKENCEVLNTEPCQERKTAWCFTFQESELGLDYFRCYATESDCVSARNDDASRCEQYPPAGP